jgi:hypothetical protein
MRQAYRGTLLVSRAGEFGREGLAQWRGRSCKHCLVGTLLGSGNDHDMVGKGHWQVEDEDRLSTNKSPCMVECARHITILSVSGPIQPVGCSPLPEGVCRFRVLQEQWHHDSVRRRRFEPT